MIRIPVVNDSRPAGRWSWPAPAICAVALILSCISAAADESLQITRDAEAAIAHARRTDRPLMFYVVNRKTDGRDRRRQRHRDAFRNADVIRAAAGFVCVELPLDRVPAEFANWGLGPHVDGHLVFTTPSGRKVHDCGINRPEGLVRDLETAAEKFAEYVWSFEVEPALNRGGGVAEQVAALDRIGRHRLREAESRLLAMVAGPPAGRSAQSASSAVEAANAGAAAAAAAEDAERLRAARLTALARLSTPRGVERLVELAAHDPGAAAALRSCDARGAERMAEWLGDGDGVRHAAVYAAIVEICGLKSPKGERFWQTAPEMERLSEIRRARAAARSAALSLRAARPGD